MKYGRLIGLIWLLSAIISILSGSYGQNPVALEVKLKDPAVVSAEIMLKQLHLTNPVLLNYADINPTIEKMIGFYENSGFPFVQVQMDSLSPVATGISGVLSITPGELVTFDTLLNRTGYRISTQVLYRLMNIRPGDRYSESALHEASEKLAQIAYLKWKRPLEIGFYPGKASVYLYPEKANANKFDGWIGLSPDLRAGGSLTFSGALTLNLNNILGQGENWQFEWHRNQDGSQKLNLASEIPYLAGLPFGLQGKFELFRQDTSYLNMGWNIGIPYYFNPNHCLNLFIRHKESSVLTSSVDIQSTIIQPYKSILSGISWESDRLDNAINPYRGFAFKLEASTGRKSIPDSISMRQSEFTANISWYQPLAKSLTCALILQSGYRQSPETYENEQYRLGGLNLLRGFDEDVFYADAYAVTSFEIRYLLDRSSHLIALADLGFLRNRKNDSRTWKNPVGLGLGGQIRTVGGIFRIIFALGKDEEVPFNLKNLKIHLGYVGVF